MSRFLVISAFLLAAAARARLLFGSELMPGINGAYYLVQARSMLEKAALGIPDLPLVFTLHALAAKTFHALGFLPLDESVLWAVKLGDSLLPALSVIPVLALASRWGKDGAINETLALMAALLVPASGLALMMVGDFQKNSLGIMLMMMLAWSLHEWLNRKSRWWALGSILLLGLIGLTHIGVFGSSLILVATTLGTLILARGKEGLSTVLSLAALALPVAAVAAGVVFWKFDPERVQRLMAAFTNPSDFLSNSPSPFGPGRDDMQWISLAVSSVAVLPALLVVWFWRRTTALGTLALMTGAAVTVIALTGPWVQGDKMMRLQMNAAPLAILCLMFALLKIPWAWLRASVGIPLLGLLLVASLPTVQRGPHLMVTKEAIAELRSLAPFVEHPRQTLIVARHGLEWWTAWTLKSNIAQAQALTPEDWQRFEHVWFLEERQPSGPRGPGLGMGPLAAGDGPPWDRMRGIGGPPVGGPDSAWFAPVLRLLGGMPGQPLRKGRDGLTGPPPSKGSGPRQPGGGPPMGMRSVAMPSEAVLLHEGAHFRLGWVESVPSFVVEGTMKRSK